MSFRKFDVQPFQAGIIAGASIMGFLFLFYLYALVRSNMLFQKSYKSNVAQAELAALKPTDE